MANREEVLGEDGSVSEHFEPVLTAAGAKKAESFIRFCDAFSIPVLTLVNVAGFKASKEEEMGMAAASAKLTYAYASATVPKVSVIIGQAFGSAYLCMGCLLYTSGLAIHMWLTADFLVAFDQIALDHYTPVSYTHLDVYKRQPLMNILKINGNNSS